MKADRKGQVLESSGNIVNVAKSSSIRLIKNTITNGVMWDWSLNRMRLIGEDIVSSTMNILY